MEKLSSVSQLMLSLSLVSLLSDCIASININTLPPDLRRFDFLDNIPPRSTINPVWRGESSAALDGEQNKVFVSWTVLGPEEGVEFQVCVIMSHETLTRNIQTRIPGMLFMQNRFYLN